MIITAESTTAKLRLIPRQVIIDFFVGAKDRALARNQATSYGRDGSPFAGERKERRRAFDDSLNKTNGETPECAWKNSKTARILGTKLAGGPICNRNPLVACRHFLRVICICPRNQRNNRWQQELHWPRNAARDQRHP